jgi:hypothetical protein
MKKEGKKGKKGAIYSQFDQKTLKTVKIGVICTRLSAFCSDFHF